MAGMGNLDGNLGFRDQTTGGVDDGLTAAAKHVFNRWYLWVTQSPSVVYYCMSPSRSGDVPIDYFAGLDRHLDQVIVVCDRFSGYKRLARENTRILLAFCWAHVRRDFLDAAKSRPDLETWTFSWVARIGRLYTLNKQRLEHWEDVPTLFAIYADPEVTNLDTFRWEKLTS